SSDSGDAGETAAETAAEETAAEEAAPAEASGEPIVIGLPIAQSGPAAVPRSAARICHSSTSPARAASGPLPTCSPPRRYQVSASGSSRVAPMCPTRPQTRPRCSGVK
ncbi:MAG: hypothetical protein ACK56I_27310, partial [bacterium]